MQKDHHNLIAANPNFKAIRAAVLIGTYLDIRNYIVEPLN